MIFKDVKKLYKMSFESRESGNRWPVCVVQSARHESHQFVLSLMIGYPSAI